MLTRSHATRRFAPAAAVALLLPFWAACSSSPIDDAAVEGSDGQALAEANTLDGLKTKRVLILSFSYDKPESGDDTACFYNGAKKLAAFYQANGATAEVIRISKEPEPEDVGVANGRKRATTFRFAPAANYAPPETADPPGAVGVFAALKSLVQQKKTFDRVITLAHGGSDGFIFASYGKGTFAGGEEQGQVTQIGWNWPNDRDNPDGPTHGAFADSTRNRQVLIDENLRALSTLTGLFRDITTPTGFVFSGGCDSGTRGSIKPGYSFVDLMSQSTGKITYGTSTVSSCWDVFNRVVKLEGGKLKGTDQENMTWDPAIRTGKGSKGACLVEAQPGNLPTPEGTLCGEHTSPTTPARAGATP